MWLLSKLRLITVDVTGTLLAYKGQLGDYYCMAAKSAGMPCPDYKRMHEGFKIAYTEMARQYPCFGFAAKMPNVDWWRVCVKDSFVKAGYDYDDDDDETFEKIFLRWLREKGLTVGVVSNAEYRYKDVVLPASVADSESWGQSGAPAFPDLVAAQEWLSKNQEEPVAAVWW